MTLRRTLPAVALALVAGCGDDGAARTDGAVVDLPPAIDVALPGILVQKLYEGSQQNAMNAMISIPITTAVAGGHRIVAIFTAGGTAGSISCGDGHNPYAIDVQLGAGGALHVTCSAVATTALGPGDTIMLGYPQFSGAATAVVLELGSTTPLLADRNTYQMANDANPVAGPTMMTSQQNEVVVASIAWRSTPLLSAFGPDLESVAVVDSNTGTNSRNLVVALREVSTADAFSLAGTLDAPSQWTAALVTYPR